MLLRWTDRNVLAVFGHLTRGILCSRALQRPNVLPEWSKHLWHRRCSQAGEFGPWLLARRATTPCLITMALYGRTTTRLLPWDFRVTAFPLKRERYSRQFTMPVFISIPTASLNYFAGFINARGWLDQRYIRSRVLPRHGQPAVFIYSCRRSLELRSTPPAKKSVYATPNCRRFYLN